MTKTHEDVITHEICLVLQEMNSSLTVEDQVLELFPGSSSHPDIYMTDHGAIPVIIENEVEPAKPDGDAEEKITLMLDNNYEPRVIGIQTPKRFRGIRRDMLNSNLRKANDFKYAIYQPDRFPEQIGRSPYLVGTLVDISNAARMLSIPTQKIEKCAKKLERAISTASTQIEGSGPDAKRNIAVLIRQPEDPQTWKIAGLIVSNALVFHSMLAGAKGIPSLEKLRMIDRTIDRQGLFATWDIILKTNYFAIFQVAKDILRELNPPEASNIINNLSVAAEDIHEQRLTNSTDMYGTLIQKVIKDRDTLKAFYTRSESAVLLACLVVPRHGDAVYGNDAKDFTIADFACGTGTLLATAYRLFGFNYEATGKKMKEIHTYMMENSIIGYDVLPSATHLAVSSLAGFFPKELFEVSRIGKMDFGRFLTMDEETVYRLGSLDLIDSDTTFDPNVTLIGGQTEEAHFNAEIGSTSCNLIIMNPPFTSNTKSDEDRLAMFSSFGIAREDQKAMTDLAKTKFRGTCKDGRAGYPTHFMAIADRKLKYGGTLGFVIPSTVANGIGYARVRKLLAERYEDVTLVTLSGGQSDGRSFSADTSIGEALLVARKRDERTINDIDYWKAEIRRSLSGIATATKKLQDMKLGRIKKNPKRTGRGPTRNFDYYVQLKRARTKSLHAAQANLAAHTDNGKIRCVVFNKRPDTHLTALSLGGALNRLDKVNGIGSPSRGGTPVMLGGKVAGYALDSPISKPWLFVSVQDPTLSQCAHRLANGELVLSDALTPYEIPMTVLGSGALGPLTREIIDYFHCTEPDESPLHYVLEGVDSEKQIAMVVEPNKMAIEKPTRNQIKKNDLLASKSKVHFNLECRFTAQSLVAMYTKEETLGGTQVPTVKLPKKHEKAFVVWANSTLGILCFWSHAPKQQLGRSKATKTGIVDMPMLDFGKLSKEQVGEFDILFDKFAHVQLDRIMNLENDAVRHKLDDGVMKILGLGDVSLCGLRQRFGREPSMKRNG